MKNISEILISFEYKAGFGMNSIINLKVYYSSLNYVSLASNLNIFENLNDNLKNNKKCKLLVNTKVGKKIQCI